MFNFRVAFSVETNLKSPCTINLQKTRFKLFIEANSNNKFHTNSQKGVTRRVVLCVFISNVFLSYYYNYLIYLFYSANFKSFPNGIIFQFQTIWAFFFVQNRVSG